MTARVNLRLPQEIFDVYQEFADNTNVTVTELIRDIAVEGAQLFHAFNTIMQRAREGDPTAAAQVAELVTKRALADVATLRQMAESQASGGQAQGDSAA